MLVVCTCVVFNAGVVAKIKVHMNYQDRERNQIPDGGTWYWTQADVFEDRKRNKSGFTVAWDTAAGGGKKAYGLYKDAEDFYKHLLQTDEDKRFGYELIPVDTECKGYADVEWIGKPDPDHTRLKSLIQFYCRRADELYLGMHRSLDIYVACGSRPVGSEGLIKHSYHITVANLIYTCNHDEAMKAFFIPPEGASEFYWTDKGTFKNIVDKSVYTRNRVFRLPYNMKRGNTVPFLRISNDTHEDDFGVVFNEEDVDDVLPMVLTQIEGSSDVYLVPKEVAVDEPAHKKKKKAPSTATASDPVVPNEESRCSVDLPISNALLKAALEAHGDTVSNLSPKVDFDTSIKDTPNWRIQCNQRGQTRKCIVNPRKSHKNNNIILFVEPNKGRHTMLLKCICMSESCKRMPRTLLGEFTQDEYFQWEFVKHQPVQTIPGEVQAQVMETGVEPVVDIFDPADTQVYSYEITKKSFERRCFRIDDPFTYAVLPNDGTFNPFPQQLCHLKLRQFFGTVEYSDPDKNGNIVKLRFIERWLSDKTLRRFTKLVVDPRNSDPKAYNMWKPYIASHLQAVPNAQVDDMVGPIILHIRDVIANGNEAHTKWFLDWLANMVQRPYQKSNVGILLYGKQGCGKGIIIEFMRTSVLGRHCTYQTSNPERDIFGKFSSGMVGNVLVQLDEVKALHSHSDVLKDLITGPTITYEEKYAKGITIDNYANLLFTTNNENALSVQTDDRRHVLFRCSDKYKGDEVYFNTLLAHLKKQDTARAVYQYLLDRDLSAYPTDFQCSRPKTEYFAESQRSSLPPMKLFMSAIANSQLEGIVNSSELYQRYRDFHKTNGHNEKFLCTHQTFSKEFIRLDGVTKETRNNQGARFKIAKKKMKEHLVHAREYDEDACLPLWFGKVSTDHPTSRIKEVGTDPMDT